MGRAWKDPGLALATDDARGPWRGVEVCDVLQRAQVDLALLICLQGLCLARVVVLVEELEVNENAFLGLSILALNQVDVRAIHVSEEGLAEVKVLRVLVDRKVLRLAKVGLLALGHHIDGG